MAFNNVIPAWVILGDDIINKYHEGKVTREEAETKLRDLNAPPSMMERLDEIP